MHIVIITVIFHLTEVAYEQSDAPPKQRSMHRFRSARGMRHHRRAVCAVVGAQYVPSQARSMYLHRHAARAACSIVEA